MFKPNYKQNKRQKELSKKAKQEEKLQRRAARTEPNAPADTADPQPQTGAVVETLDVQP